MPARAWCASARWRSPSTSLPSGCGWRRATSATGEWAGSSSPLCSGAVVKRVASVLSPDDVLGLYREGVEAVWRATRQDRSWSRRWRATTPKPWRPCPRRAAPSTSPPSASWRWPTRNGCPWPGSSPSSPTGGSGSALVTTAASPRPSGIHAWDLASSASRSYRPADPGLLARAWTAGSRTFRLATVTRGRRSWSPQAGPRRGRHCRGQ